MSDRYRIGDYEFDTYEEYLEAQEDVKKIDYITKEVDITDADAALRLYTLIRNKEIVFRSKIGISFSWFLTDVVAKNSQNLLEERRKQEERQEQGNKLKVAGIFCMIGAVLCLSYYGLTVWQDYQKGLEYEKLQNMQNMTGHVIEDSHADGETGADSEEQDDSAENHAADKSKKKKKEQTKEQKPTVLSKYKKLYKQNKDLAGWLKIKGTNIDYPVMQTGTDQSDFYLHYDFDKKESTHGSLFLDARNNTIDRDTNLIIYGHNMKDGTMFGGLQNYMDKEYWEQHRELTFDTIYEKARYTIEAVCLSKVNYQDEDTFRYYNFLNAKSKAEFRAFLSNIQQLSVFEHTIDLSYGDELLTLSTCNYYIQDGRLFLIAKKE